MITGGVAWGAYQGCPQCGARAGGPCRSLSGYVPGALGGVADVEADAPHARRRMRSGVQRTAEPTVRVSEHFVSMLPEDHIDHPAFLIEVAYRGRGLWAVLRRGRCLGRDGEWDYESVPSERTDEWLNAHRFPEEEALRLAREAAPHLTVNGFSVADVLADAEKGKS